MRCPVALIVPRVQVYIPTCLSRTLMMPLCKEANRICDKSMDAIQATYASYTLIGSKRSAEGGSGPSTESSSSKVGLADKLSIPLSPNVGRGVASSLVERACTMLLLTPVWANGRGRTTFLIRRLSKSMVYGSRAMVAL